ncbi:MAG: hypothetical protein AUH85_06620 [Chloroflexi bacterium 13_1_40CM_4_68_4]|nr:MAG: hypothetical protein AUH85_06620 [Chloroflexi bacterium 13_1_40CM_4_68_4]
MRLNRLAVLVIGVVVACTATPSPAATPTASPAATEAPSPAASPTATATPQPTTWPLTGMPLNGGDPSLRPIAVRFDNALPAQPQAGLNSADMVFDTLIEACVSRLLAVYQSKSADPVGAIRSARLYDLQLMPLFRAALAHVGAADEVSQMLKDKSASGAFVDIDAYKYNDYPAYASFYWRVGYKSAPYNEYSSIPSLRKAAATAPGGSDAVTVPDWGFLPQDHQPLDGGFAASAAGTKFSFPASNGQACPQGQNIAGYRDEYAPTYTYDAAAAGYRRAANGRNTMDETTKQPVLAKNVLIIYTDLSVTDIVESQGSWGVAYSILPHTTGSGRLLAYRDGRKPFVFTSGAGERIFLSPGQTWIHIVPSYWSLSTP